MASLRRIASTILLLPTLCAAYFVDEPTKTINVPTASGPPHLLIQRQTTNCIPNTFPCSNSLGSAWNGICCQIGYVCALDAAGNPACCPPGAVCTGTAPATAPPPTAAAVSYVPNPYFPFPYIPNSFPNSAACASAVSQCSHNFNACTTGLGGSGGFGVTVVVNGASTVAAASANNLGAAATAVCASLSSVACGNIQSTQCAQYGNSPNLAARARPTAACVAGLAVGFGAAIIGAM